ncbi:hypothetical protein HRR83_000691 [Exophiala dermatitidis]|uniref:Uncharacterized protein n=1 Tax=Exophiala dermatitidis TaxID=5970 RepID=A0AAN6F4N1_EXODE|nr:hypothetical protein HRR74_000694 [Exophiala dermatitidis]KAJ4528573.1 hypothetical protein HRR73_001196 [Exophiala dermatitidis]KAJ4529945.1 hypothetical protein HRR76_009192 [Exophiala dermatitidis]KAJ4558706.1 hypothetical protein HRR77_000692 [Exophiala dermatitidis]KAJ4581264.1 hypothetical protein HRR79_000307 [Exophiala dermatitidis]
MAMEVNNDSNRTLQGLFFQRLYCLPAGLRVNPSSTSGECLFPGWRLCDSTTPKTFQVHSSDPGSLFIDPTLLKIDSVLAALLITSNCFMLLQGTRSRLLHQSLVHST